MVKSKNDLTGQKICYLTVIKQAEDYIKPDGTHVARWLCKCDCGNDNVIVRNDAIGKSTKSCGCLQRKIAKETMYNNAKKYNTYDLSGEYGIGYTTKGEEFYFDLEDYDLIKDYCWWLNDSGYLIAGKSLRMHRLIMNVSDKNSLIDHINHNTKDNRKSNLRIATNSQNNMNSKMPNNNTSGITGVSWNKLYDKWEAHISVNGKKMYLGLFDKFEDAAKARKESEEKYFGEYSYDNSMKISKMLNY